ncbi:hypothetical protein DMC30DRAFT_403150 [Rhodotorula diobovata]|uniref:Uncharacterized protein n=1 Tax=Rhodotorula diobovata TaxID=5288 RepID=A0A5C5FQ17_9BASI|nr:hypothetical protein DMC30DRAFT_403150 [Rhodotorula diobovata]
MASTTSTSSSDVFPPYPLHSDNAPPYPLRPTADASSYFSTLPERSSSFSSSSTVTPSDLDLDELLSSCSSWPSPRTPLDPYALLCLKDNYPPVPYPPPAPAPSSLGLGGAGIDPRWMDACALNVPPLELSALALYSWPDEGVAPPLCTGADVGAGVGVGVAAGSEPAVKAHEVGDVMLTLPLEPAFAGEWTATGAVRGRGPM